MKTVRFCFVIFYLITASLFTLPALSAETKSGTITEMGFGKFIMEDESGTQQRFHIKKKTTVFSPNSWRPMNGDKVQVSYVKASARSGIILKLTKVELLEAGPASQAIKSPMEVEIIDISHRKILVVIPEVNTEMRFDRTRKTRLVPDGWVPAPGDRAIIHFHSKSARFSFGIVQIADKVEKV